MLVRVFKIPPPDGKWCFGGGKPITFTEVDWFRTDPHSLHPEPYTQQEVADFVKTKNYYTPDIPLLVLTQEYSFTLNYRAP